MSLPLIRIRRPLQQWNKQMLQGTVTIGFLGGSITDARPRHNWPEYVREWLVATYPDVRFRIENAAIGATGSDLAALRVKRDIIKRDCDAVWIEYAVNDSESPSRRRRRTQEGLIRQLRKAGIEDIVLVYTFSSDMQALMEQGVYPPSIAELEELAQHYGIPSVWVGLHGLREVAAGRMSMEEWLPDGLHPQEQGSRLYAECVISYLQQALTDPKQLQHTLNGQRIDNQEAIAAVRESQEATPKQNAQDSTTIENQQEGLIVNRANQERASCDKDSVGQLPQPLDPLCWEQVEELDITAISTTGRWVEHRWHSYEWVDLMLETTELNAGLSFEFEGRGVAIVFDFGYQSAEFYYRLDEGEWTYSNRDCPDWVGAEGWYRLFDCGDELGRGKHRFELVVTEPKEHRIKHETSDERYLRIGRVGIIR